MEYIILIFAILCMAYFWTRIDADFVVWVKNGQIDKVEGIIHGSFEEDMEKLLAPEHHGKIFGRRQDRFTRLSFKGNFDESIQQRLRNLAGLL